MNFIKTINRIISVNWLLTLYANIYYFGIYRAFCFPILIGYGTKIESWGERGCIDIQTKFGQLCFGLKGGPFKMGGPDNFLYIGKRAKIKIDGTCRFAKGIRLKVFDEAILQIGDGFTSNADLIISCMKSISIGNDCLIGWNVSILDNDGGHCIVNCVTNDITNSSRPVFIGKHVWLSSNTSILKGVTIPNNCVVGYGSNLIGKNSFNEGSIIAGNPPKEVKTGCTWQH